MREIRILIAPSVPNWEVPHLQAAVEDFMDDNLPSVYLLVSAGPVGDDAEDWHAMAQEEMNSLIDEDVTLQATHSSFNGG